MGKKIVRKLKMMQSNGTLSDEIPIGAKAENVITNSNTNLEDISSEVINAKGSSDTLKDRLDGMDANLTKAITEVLKTLNPIGTIRMSTNNVNPSTYLGFGTWIAWGSGKVPVGIDTSDTNFNTAEKTGGNKTHTHTYSHTHSVPGSKHTHTYGLRWARFLWYCL